MSFDDLPPQTPINPQADAYAETCLLLSRKAAAEVPSTLDVPYGSDYWQKMDIYRPKSGGTGLPALMFFHGGNFTHGYKEWCGFMAPAITAFPAVFVSVSYRLAPATSYRDILRDAFASLVELRRIAPEHGIDPGRVFVSGHSAGGQIVAQMALRRDWRAEAGLGADAFRAALPVSATFTRRLADHEADPALHVGADVPDSPVELAAGGADVPFLVTWGGREKSHVQEAGPLFVDALKAGGAAVETLVRPEDDHFSIHLRTADPDDAWTARVRGMMTAG